MRKSINNKSVNSDFLELLVKDIFFSKNSPNITLFNINPFFSYFEKKLKENLKKIKDQRCLGYIKILIDSYTKEKTFLKVHREQGNLKARLIQNYNLNDELIIINTAGGLTSGDVNVNLIKISDNIKINITTQSMEKIYKCNNFSANCYTNIIVGAHSYVSWLPLETIFFDGGNLRRRINIDLGNKSTFLGVETIIFGRQAMGEIIKKGNLDDAWQIFQNGKLLYSDFNRINGNIHRLLSNTLIMRGHNIFCNIVFVGKKIKIYKKKISNYLANSRYFAGVSLVNGVLLLKVLVKDISEIRVFLDNLISMFDENFNLPKLWNS